MATAERVDPATSKTGNGDVGCVMQVVTSGDDEIQWFQFVPSLFAPIIRIEWERDTMNVVLPANMADTLIKKGYARHMKASEASAYNQALDKGEPKETET